MFSKSFIRIILVLIAPVTDYFLEMKDTGSFSLEKVLQEQPVILREQGSGTGKSASAFLEKIGIPEDKLHIAARINDQEAIKNLVAGGLGVSIVSEKAVHDYIDAKSCCSSNCRDISPVENFISSIIRILF